MDQSLAAEIICPRWLFSDSVTIWLCNCLALYLPDSLAVGFFTYLALYYVP